MGQEKNVSNVRFGRALAIARTAIGMTQQKLGHELGRSDSHISNVERGERRMVPGDVRSADKILKAGGRLVRLHRELYEAGALAWLDTLASLQAGAEMIREYHCTLIPGLLQTPGYARAVISAGAPWLNRAEVEDLVTARMARSERILSKETPHYNVVVDDTVVERIVGSRETMGEQIGSLLALAESGRVMLQLYRFDLWPHPGLGGPFSLLSSATAPDVVHVESVYGGQTADEPTTIRRFAMLFSGLQANARTPGETVDYLRDKKERDDDD